MDLRDKKIIITGGKGFLGTHLCEHLKQTLNIPITDLDTETVKSPKPGAYIFKSDTIDLISTEQTNWLFKVIKPDVVIHLAAVVGGIKANKNNPGTYFYKNMMMGMNIIEACRIFKTEKLTLIGTICSYPKFTPTPFKEMDLWNGYPEETNAPYGIAKKALITQAQAYKQEYGLNTISLLLANLYGPYDNFDLETSHVIPALIRKIYEAKKFDMPTVECWGTGTATREFLHVRDAAIAIAKATSFYDRPDPVNIGTGSETTIKDLANTIAETMRYKGQIVWNNNQMDGQPKRTLSTNLAQERFGFEARIGLTEGLKETVKWYEQHN